VVFLPFHVLYLARVTYYSYTAHVRPCLQPAQARYTLRLHMESAWNPKDNYDISASVYVVQLNGFMSLRC